jgi:hypothetical protein
VALGLSTAIGSVAISGLGFQRASLISFSLYRALKTSPPDYLFIYIILLNTLKESSRRKISMSSLSSLILMILGAGGAFKA